MATYEQLPGAMNLTLRSGDDLTPTEIDFSISISGFSFSAPIQSTVTGETLTSFSVAVTDAAAGKLTVALTDTQTTALPAGTYKWSLVGTSGTATRTYLSGYVEVTR
jgi:hypothetical protein